MSKLREAVQGVQMYAVEVIAEIRKSTWPERQELIESTVVVIASVLLLGAFVGVSDKVLVTLIKLLIR